MNCRLRWSKQFVFIAKSYLIEIYIYELVCDCIFRDCPKNSCIEVRLMGPFLYTTICMYTDDELGGPNQYLPTTFV